MPTVEGGIRVVNDDKNLHAHDFAYLCLKSCAEIMHGVCTSRLYLTHPKVSSPRPLKLALTLWMYPYLFRCVWHPAPFQYMELRTKLDWTRQKADKDVRRARAQASTLRTKWALLCGDGAGGENSLLDSMRVDSAPNRDHSSSAPVIMGNGGRNKQSRQQQCVSRGGGSPPVTAKSTGGGGVGGRGPSSRTGLRSGGGAGNPRGWREGAMSASQSEPSLLAPKTQQQQQLWQTISGGGGMGIGGGVGREIAENASQRLWVGASPATSGSNNSSMVPGNGIIGGGLRGSPAQGGVSFNPGLSAGSDPGGGRLLMTDVGDYRGGGGGGGEGKGNPRPPWSEQGGKAAGGGRHAPPLLYA